MRRKVFRVLSIILSAVFCIGLSIWLITCIQGTGFLYAVTLKIPILACIIGYILTIITTIVTGLRNGFKSIKIQVTLHLIPLLLIAFIAVDESEMLKSRRIVTAYLRDDLGVMEMILRDNGTYEMNSIGIFLVTKKHSGAYRMDGDTIRFLDPPTENDYIPVTALVDTDHHRIYFNRTSTGDFDTTKTFLNYFEIVDK